MSFHVQIRHMCHQCFSLICHTVYRPVELKLNHLNNMHNCGTVTDIDVLQSAGGKLESKPKKNGNSIFDSRFGT